MIAAALGLFLAAALFHAEALRGRRILLPELRQRADAAMERSARSFARVGKAFSASSLRLFFHYALHQLLGAFLLVVRFLERQLHRLRAKNKVIAKDIRAQAADNHLAHIARHKEAVALSDSEREERKLRSLED